MRSIMSSVIRLSMATTLAGVALLWNGNLPTNTRSSFVSSADAIIGRPLTPLSYAGVARRTTARAYGYGAAGAVYGGAVYGAPVVVVAPPVVVAPSCVQAVDPYGRIYTRCY
jgi:hypothetical protein